MRARGIIIGLLTLLGAAIWAVVHLWQQIDVSLPFYGWLALAGGASVTLLLAAGLVLLMRLSQRRGYDDEAGHL